MSDCTYHSDEFLELGQDDLDLVLGGSSVPSGAQEAAIPWGSLIWDYVVWYVKDQLSGPYQPSPNGTPDTGAQGSSGQEGTGGAPGF